MGVIRWFLLYKMAPATVGECAETGNHEEDQGLVFRVAGGSRLDVGTGGGLASDF
jgi:hypothetical protein